ncbi:IucA/IucC family protein [Cytobacillus sp. IB215665]|uniref:IucA/IucC family protein n=1 Tax=Cytobacillus sp. IB215665 TaxID=3097357 RepID=UPI002A134070|nr:IucA/IucC family protein [Cytobacillus sp. IB215665]MDX8365600.1 IucA/IucC family protein [Cytobacillus sp. IB215665]
MNGMHTNTTTMLSQTTFDNEEQKALSYIKTEKPELLDTYIKNIHAGRRGIFQRLFQSLVRERIISEERITWLEGKQLTIRVRLSDVQWLQADVKKLHSLGRFDLAGDIMLCSHKNSHKLAHPAELLEILKNEGLFAGVDDKQYERFKLEIQNGVANLALALTGAERRKQDFPEYIQTSMEWVIKQRQKSANFSPLAFFEQWVVEGHTLHPGAKTKLGLEVGDVVHYSPEWGASPKVVIIAVSKMYCQTTSVNDLTVKDYLYEEYTGLQEIVENYLIKSGLNPDQFDLVLVHPWQFKHTLGGLYKNELEQHHIIPIPEFSLPTQSLISFRSLAPIQRWGQKKHHIKTAINVQTTSAVRTVSPNSVENGPMLSKLFAVIQQRENHFDNTFIVLQERAGSYFQPLNQQLSNDERWTYEANLACILRENPENYVSCEEEIAMPAAALLAQSPISDKKIVIELIEELANRLQTSNNQEAALLFISKYAQVSLRGFLTLMVRYGISLEGHMQNSVSVFRNGELVKMIVRDFGGIRVLPERLEKQGFHATFYPNSSIVTNDVTQLRNIISYSVMQNHIAELITCIVRELDVDEEELWKQVKAVCSAIFSKLKVETDINSVANEDEEALFQPMIDLKGLTTMRLQGDITSYSYKKVPNPLAKWKGENNYE